MFSGCRPYSSGPRMMFLMEKSKGVDCCAAIGCKANSNRSPVESLRIRLDCWGTGQSIDPGDCGEEFILESCSSHLPARFALTYELRDEVLTHAGIKTRNRFGAHCRSSLRCERSFRQAPPLGCRAPTFSRTPLSGVG